MTPAITCLFVDIGGVLLTNGWDHDSRKLAAEHFGYDYAAADERHRLTFETLEIDKMSLDDYLDQVIFFEERTFTRAAYREFMFAQSEVFPEMIDLITTLKARHGLKVIVVSNESRELNDFRIREFRLGAFVDAFVSSCFVNLRKPDLDIFRLALDLAQVPVEQVVFIDNTDFHVQAAARLGLQGIHHTDYESTRARLAEFGLR